MASIDSVTLAPGPCAGAYLCPAIGSSQYAVFHGTFAGGNTFTVGADGPDLIAVYDTRTGPSELVGKGSLVLQGVWGEHLRDQALSPATASGSEWQHFGQAAAGPQGATLSTVLDRADPADVMGLIAT